VILTPGNKLLIDKLNSEGKKLSEIMEITGLPYRATYSFINRVKIEAQRQKRLHYQSRNVNSYVDTGKEMPPIYKSELKIIASKELAELACEQMGLGKPVSMLSQRPMSFNANGWVRVGNKWVAGQTIYNEGVLIRQPAFTQ